MEAGKYRFYTGGQNNATEALVTALTSVRRNEGKLVGHTPDLVMALYMTHKALSSTPAVSSRTSLSGGGKSEKEREMEQSNREKRRALKGSPVGESILSNRDGFGR
jgi:hypothetical protein